MGSPEPSGVRSWRARPRPELSAPRASRRSDLRQLSGVLADQEQLGRLVAGRGPAGARADIGGVPSYRNGRHRVRAHGSLRRDAPRPEVRMETLPSLTRAEAEERSALIEVERY